MPELALKPLDLSPELHALIVEAVASGEFASDGDVIRDALAAWQARRATQAASRDLRSAWEDGLASGPSPYADIDEIKQAARRRGRTAPR